MTRMIGTSKRGLVPRVLCCLLFALAALVWSAAPGEAHTELIGSSPASGQRLASSPQRVELTFNQALLGSGAAVRLRDSAGATVATGTAVVQGTAVTVPVPAGLAGGAYEVRWRVVAGDGHPVEGAFSFVVAPAPAPTAAATTAPGTVPATAPTGPSLVTPTTTIGEREATSTAEVSLGATAAVVFGGAAMVAIVVALVVRMRRR